MLAEWDWTEEFAGQPELERYFNAVADKYDLRRDIDFDTRVASMTFDEETDDWTIVSEAGATYTAHVVVTALGVLSAPIYPQAPGIESFQGEHFHSARWPQQPVDFTGKKVVVVGTGSTGVQVIPHIARDAECLTVLMRTANWVIPLNNRPIGAEEMAEVRAGYPELHEYLKGTFGGFMHDVDMTPSTAYTEDELLTLYEDRWTKPGFAKWVGMPYDVLSKDEKNAHYGEWMKARIRERVTDPAIAEKLMPDQFFGAKPVECETLPYYEVYNQDNVELVSVKADPIVEFTPRGVRTSEREIEADVIVFATGFEAFVGSLNRTEITGVGGKVLGDVWADGPTTYLGIGISDFPNLLMVGGPHGKGGHGNSPRCAEYPLQWIADLAETVTREGIRRVEAEPEAEAEWTEHVLAAGEASVVSKARSSFLFGDNVEGRKRGYVAYIGSLPDFVARLQETAAAGYRGFRITR